MALPIEKVLRQFWLPGITSVSGNLQKGLQAFLLDDRYRIYKLSSPNEFEITPFDAIELKQAICHDLSRMACASFESIFNVDPPPDLNMSTGWGVIRSYYAAFFAAHSIMRIFGVCCTQLDSVHVQYISRVGTFSNLPQIKHSSGLYKATWDEAAGVLRFSKPAENSHEVTWKIFLDTLLGVRDALLGGTALGLSPDLQHASAELESLRDKLCIGGFNFGNWLSNMRNRVNYRHDFNAWFPYGKAGKIYPAIWQATEGRWLRAPMPIKNIPLQGREIEMMLELSGAIVALCRCFIEHIGEASSTGNSFVNFGPKSFIDFTKR